MKQTLLSLLKLTEIDQAIYKILEDRKEIPARVKELSAEIKEQQSIIEEQQGIYDELAQQVKEANAFISEKSQWADEREARINDVKTNKEFQAVSREIALARKDIKDKQAELEEIQPRLQNAEEGLKQVKEEVLPSMESMRTEILELKERFDAGKATLSERQNGRDAAAKEVTDQKVLAVYDRLRKRTSPAIALIDDNGHCAECGTKVLPQTINILITAPSMQQCNQCKRIVYVQSMLED